MSELTKPEWKTFSDYFLPKYNDLNNSGYLFVDKNPRTSNSDWDFYDAKGNILSVQHTRAIGTQEDVKMEISRPKISELFINILKEQLQLYGVTKCHVHLNISNPPHTKSEAKSAAYWVAEWIRKRYYSSNKGKIASYDQEEYDIYIKKCMRWVSEIDLYENDELRLGFGWSKYPIDINGVLDSPERFVNAITKKESKNYINPGELVLIVDFSPFPFDEVDIEKFKEYFKSTSTKFKSIWVYQLWSGARGAFEIYKQ